jgi:LysM repeat protein
MNTKIEDSNAITTIRNAAFLQIFKDNAERDDKLISVKVAAEKVHEISDIFTIYIEDLKNAIKSKNTPEFLDELFFNGSDITREGEEFLNYIEQYRSSMISTIITLKPDIAGMVKNTFDIGAIEDRKGKQTDWLTLNYKGFPSISSIIKLSQMQADIKGIETKFYASMLNFNFKDSKKKAFDEGLNKTSVAINTPSENTNTEQVEVLTDVSTTVDAPKIETPKKIEVPKVEETKKPEVKVVEPEKETPKKVVTHHKVSKGETLYSISRKYGLKPNQLKKLNGMTNNRIEIGQKLRVK